MKQYNYYFIAAIVGLLLTGCDTDSSKSSTPSTTSTITQSPNAAEPSTINVRVLALNDFHGALQAPGKGELGGIESIATLMAQQRQQQPNNIVVGVGDLVGASPLLSAMFYDEPTIAAMNAIGMEASVVGNHEFDKGKAELRRKQQGGCHPTAGCFGAHPFAGAQFSYLAANVIDIDSGKTLFPAYYIKTFDTIPVAFIGVVLEGAPSSITPSGVAGLTFKDEVETINQLVAELTAKNIQSIGVLLHEGATQQSDAKDINGCEDIKGNAVDIVKQLDKSVDFVLSGHTHKFYNCMIEGIPLISGQNNGLMVSEIDLTIDKQSRDVVAVNAKNIAVETKQYQKDPALTQLLSEYEKIAEPIANQKIGQLLTSVDKTLTENGDSLLGNLIADGQLYVASQAGQGDAQIAFMNSGGIRAPLKAGDIRYNDIYTVQPFSNMLVTKTLTGQQLKDLLEQQWTRSRPQVMPVSKGFYYEWDAAKPAGERVIASSMKLNGQAIDKQGYYRVAANEYLALGGSDFSVFNQGTDGVYSLADNEALMKYFRDNSPIAVPTDIRIKKVN